MMLGGMGKGYATVGLFCFAVGPEKVKENYSSSEIISINWPLAFGVNIYGTFLSLGARRRSLREK